MLSGGRGRGRGRGGERERRKGEWRNGDREGERRWFGMDMDYFESMNSMCTLFKRKKRVGVQEYDT